MEYVFMLVMVIFNVMMYINYKHDLYKESTLTNETIDYIKQDNGNTYTTQPSALLTFIFGNLFFGAITYTTLSIVQRAVGS